MRRVFVCGRFDDLRSRDVRFLQEAARLGELTVRLWSDESLRRRGLPAPAFPEAERAYLLESLRWVGRVERAEAPANPDRPAFPQGAPHDLWAVREAEDNPARRAHCQAHSLGYRVIPEAGLEGFPLVELAEPAPGREKVIVTGCYDWLHSGHVRFFEEVSGLGALFVSLGSDPTIQALKGNGHPLLPQDERLYMVQSVRYVSRAFVATGSGYLDAEPEIELLKPEIYAVNEDGDRPDKRLFCARRGIRYVVLKRLPKEGLPSRQSTRLRGF